MDIIFRQRSFEVGFTILNNCHLRLVCVALRFKAIHNYIDISIQRKLLQSTSKIKVYVAQEPRLYDIILSHMKPKPEPEFINFFGMRQ